MPRPKVSELRKLEATELGSRLSELRAELARLRSMQGRGTLRKDSGKIRAVRRNIARLLSVMNEKKELP